MIEGFLGTSLSFSSSSDSGLISGIATSFGLMTAVSTRPNQPAELAAKLLGDYNVITEGFPGL